MTRPRTTLPASISKVLTAIAISAACGSAFAQSGEAGQESPEERDARWTAADSAREAALFQDIAAAPRTAPTLGNQAAAVDLVIGGRVQAQTYVYDASGRPYTHTTVRIESRIRGDYQDNEITLIQEGGPGKQITDNVVIISDAHYFNVGEEELLFLNLDTDNPLVTERVQVAQRFRVYKGQVFGVDGHGVMLRDEANGAGQSIAWTRDRHPAPRFNQIHIGPHTLTKQFGDEVAESQRGEFGVTRSIAVPSYRSSVDADSFRAALTAGPATEVEN